MKNIQDIRQRDMIIDGHVSGWINSTNIPLKKDTIKQYEMTTKLKNNESYSIMPWILGLMIFLLSMWLFVGGYNSGYKQAKIDYHIKP